MDRTATEATLKVFLREIRKRLDESASIAIAAEACANAGQVDKAVSVAMDLEQPVHEATDLLNATCLLKRLSGQPQDQGPAE